MDKNASVTILNHTSAWVDYACIVNQPDPTPAFNFAQIFMSFPIIIGNALVIATIMKTHALHTVPYYFICNLAVADMWVGIVLFAHSAAFLFTLKPFKCIILWCSLHQNVNLCALLASAILYVTVTVERFLSIVYPLHSEHFLPEKRVKLILGGIWAVIFVIFVLGFWVYVKAGSTGFQCTTEFGGEYFWFWLWITVIFGPVALVTIAYCYTRIIITAIRQQRAINATTISAVGTTNSSQSLQHKMQIVKVLVLTIGLSLLCWLPALIAFFVTIDCHERCGLTPENYQWPTMPTFCNSMANIFVYSYKLEEFRTALKKIIRCE